MHKAANAPLACNTSLKSKFYSTTSAIIATLQHALVNSCIAAPGAVCYDTHATTKPVAGT